MKKLGSRRSIGVISASVGIVIALALILPSSVWWFTLAFCLIITGLILIFRY